MYKILETDRLRIRPINTNDADFVLELVNSDSWKRFIGDRNVLTNTDAVAYIKKIQMASNYFYNVFELKDTRQALGIVTLIEREHQTFPDIGFALLPMHEKQGYALEASHFYLTEIIKLNKYKNIIAITDADNLKSISLLEKLGLRHNHDYQENSNTLSFFSLNQIKKS